MLKHYVEFFYPGSFVPESSIQEVIDRAVPVEVPKGAYGFHHFSREEIEQAGELLMGKPKDYDPMTYYGEILTLEQVQALEPARNYNILVSNMECNGWNQVVRTVCGNFQPLNEGDKVVSP